MSNEWLRADAAMMMDALSAQMSRIAAVQRERARLTATVTACDKRIQVTVNADGVLIETKFAPDIGDLTYDEIAKAMTEAVQSAVRKVQAAAGELVAPLQEHRSRLPKLSDMLEDVPDLTGFIPVAPPASLAPPGAPERRDEDAQSARYSDVEDYRPPRSMISDADR
ncbi:YbaB/EbfC family nucleoid-associated protein [Nocardia sp. NPDC003482]|uniref:YbaB/EbfC family nucleoid-associated protein n=1 Tax=Nocardia sp. NPDC004068 TaxID=3364303 RepID=UPI0036A0B21A